MNDYFDREELECNCGCGQNTVDWELMEVLLDVRDFFGKPVLITSGNRCKKHNKKIGGSPRSQHLLGKAADIVVIGIEPSAVYEYLCGQYSDRHGIGLYKEQQFVHIDVREDEKRWEG